MADKHSSSSRLGWTVGIIWLVVLVLGGAIFIVSQFPAIAAPASLNGGEAAGIFAVQEEAAPPTVTATRAPSATLPPSTPTFTVQPSETPLPSATLPEVISMITPVAFPSITPTPETLFEGPIVIGYSVQDRPIEVYRFGRGPDRYLIVAGIHGGYEINTIYLADQLIAYFTKKPDAVPTNATLYILRSLNPDGEAIPHSKDGRANANGVDLNRSFPVGWAETWDRDGCWDLLELNAGEYGGSEPETVALMAFVLEHPILAVVSYHAAAPGFYPAGEPADPDSVALAEYLSKVTGYPYPAYHTGCYMTGSMVDWTLTTGAAGVDVELSTHWDTEFAVNLNLVLALLRWKP